MSDEKPPEPEKPKFENPLSRMEMIVICTLIIVFGLLQWGQSQAISGQVRELSDLERQKSGIAQQDEANRIEGEIQKAKEFRKQNEAWTKVMPSLEKYFPTEASGQALSYIDLLQAVSTVKPGKLLSSNEEASVILEFTANGKGGGAEEEEEISFDDEEEEEDEDKPKTPPEETIPPDLLVRYREQRFKLKLQTTYFGWLQVLDNLEKMGKFYRLKKVTITEEKEESSASAGASSMMMGGGDQGQGGKKPKKKKSPYTIRVEGDFCSYSVMEFTKASSEEEEEEEE